MGWRCGSDKRAGMEGGGMLDDVGGGEVDKVAINIKEKEQLS